MQVDYWEIYFDMLFYIYIKRCICSISGKLFEKGVYLCMLCLINILKIGLLHWGLELQMYSINQANCALVKGT